MNPEDNDKEQAPDSLPQTTYSDLQGKQSVRATFKLSARAIDVLSVVAAHLGIKQKSLFDYLIEDGRSLRIVAGEIEDTHFRQLQRIQKTFVLSRHSLSSLEAVAKSFDTPRDALVEYSIQRLLPIIAAERKKHRHRKQLFKDIRQYCQQGEALLQKARAMLPDDDPIAVKLAVAVKVLANACADMEAFIEKADVIEDFNLP